MTKRNGVPEKITIDFVRAWVEPRVSAKRFKHIKGVAKVARQIAERHNCDIFFAELSAWLHDACKEMKEKELVEAACHFQIPFGEIEAKHGHLLHGPVAAAVAKEELGITNIDLLAAIAEHTLGNAPMCPLSETLFLADCLEEGRARSYTAPIWAALKIDEERINVPHAIVVASDLGLVHLIESGRPIHPRTVEVRNFYMQTLKEATCP
ncbi:MAG: bis(5'-nucleosyl)-tetraphosphatase (symmetrical) YqeK [Candidatus Obscuribacterales bacterium]|nr:bis(5'-nucleosyl)-tetraphosphatase (symmetrical) YqeK [Candidatus Obscuribacterales bacterium]